jgi:hypothetical protein
MQAVIATSPRKRALKRYAAGLATSTVLVGFSLLAAAVVARDEAEAKDDGSDRTKEVPASEYARALVIVGLSKPSVKGAETWFHGPGCIRG